MKAINIQLVMVLLLITSLLSANETSSPQSEWFAKERFSGLLSFFYEEKDYHKDATTKENEGFSVFTLRLKYEAPRFHNFDFGLELFANQHVHDHNGRYRTDFEGAQKLAVPVAYLRYHFNEKLSLTAGRYLHKKISAINDGWSEGAYLRWKENDELDFHLGFSLRFADIDYDDLEDFGRRNNAQDFSEDKFYGEDSDNFVLWGSSRIKIYNKQVQVKPFFNYQDRYSFVPGYELTGKFKLANENTFGFSHIAYYVEDLRIAEQESSYHLRIDPYYRFSHFELGLLLARYGQGLSKPRHLRTYTELDQAFHEADTEEAAVDAYGIKFAYRLGKFYTHYFFSYWTSNPSDTDDKIETYEQEIKAKYKITKEIDIELRLMDLDFKEDNEFNDYQKVEIRCRWYF